MHEGKATVNVWVELAATEDEARPTSCCVESHWGPFSATNILYDDKLIGAVQLVWFVNVNDAVLVPNENESTAIDPFWESVSNWLAESVHGVVDVGVEVGVIGVVGVDVGAVGIVDVGAETTTLAACHVFSVPGPRSTWQKLPLLSVPWA
jgi:hypothetical protein